MYYFITFNNNNIYIIDTVRVTRGNFLVINQ